MKLKNSSLVLASLTVGVCAGLWIVHANIGPNAFALRGADPLRNPQPPDTITNIMVQAAYAQLHVLEREMIEYRSTMGVWPTNLDFVENKKLLSFQGIPIEYVTPETAVVYGERSIELRTSQDVFGSYGYTPGAIAVHLFDQ